MVYVIMYIYDPLGIAGADPGFWKGGWLAKVR